VRNADRFGPRCIQPARGGESIHNFGPEPESEDCLYLNIWTGAQHPDANLPVMVWIHGGAYYQGSGALPVFNGENLARQGAVIVTVNYRLGRLGFLAHPGLSKESPHRASGNYGYLDLVAALHWVKRNISAFGGDPRCVTLIGQSVGSASVSAFMTSPLTKNLFHRAIGQSGGALGASDRAGGTSMAYLDSAEEAGLKFAQALGANSVESLRARSADEIQLSRPETGWTIVRELDPSQVGIGARDIAWPVIDGFMFSERPRDVFARGIQHDVPLLTGANEDEHSLMFALARSQPDYIARAHEQYGALADKFLALYPARNDAEACIAGQYARADETFASQNWIWARMHAVTAQSKTFHYRFQRVPDMPRRELGAFHGAEIPYIFRNLDVRDWAWQSWDRSLSEMMSTYWLNFMRAGDPNGACLLQWPAFDPARGTTLIFGDEVSISSAPEHAKLEFWEAKCLRDQSSGGPAATSGRHVTSH
jgi:para-nitrobenzyl esterase